MNSEQARGGWNEVVGAVREKYGQLTREDIEAAKGSVQNLIGTIQRKTGEARESIERFVQNAGGSTSEYANRIYNDAAEYASAAGERLRDQYDRVSGSISGGVDEAKRRVQERPVESILTAFGMGLAAGAVAAILLSGRRR